jgi:hypothetical protein
LIEENISEFCKGWLSAWTGNDPNSLIKFYSERAYYQDPANPTGLIGHQLILSYFKRLLAANPKWKWVTEEIFATKKGFILKWRATIPVGPEKIVEHGIDIVEIEEGKITRNEVYFDRSRLLSLLKQLKRARSL